MSTDRSIDCNNYRRHRYSLAKFIRRIKIPPYSLTISVQRFAACKLQWFKSDPFSDWISQKSRRDNPEVINRIFSSEINTYTSPSRYHDLEFDTVPFSRTLDTGRSRGSSWFERRSAGWQAPHRRTVYQLRVDALGFFEPSFYHLRRAT